jgi:hypothetical protein
LRREPFDFRGYIHIAFFDGIPFGILKANTLPGVAAHRGKSTHSVR